MDMDVLNAKHDDEIYGDDGLFDDYYEEPEFCECDDPDDCGCGLENEDDYTMRILREKIVESGKKRGLSAEEAIIEHCAPAKKLAQTLANRMLKEYPERFQTLVTGIATDEGRSVEEVSREMLGSD